MTTLLCQFYHIKMPCVNKIGMESNERIILDRILSFGYDLENHVVVNQLR